MSKLWPNHVHKSAKPKITKEDVIAGMDDEQLEAFNLLADTYRFHALECHGVAVVSNQVIARLIRDGWRLASVVSRAGRKP